MNAADSARCADLLAALPQAVADRERRGVTEESSRFAAAYGEEPLIVRCSGQTPRGFDSQTSQCVNVDDVGWFIPDEVLDGPDPDGLPATLSTVKRELTVEVLLPPEAWPPAASFADLSPTIARTIPGAEC